MSQDQDTPSPSDYLFARATDDARRLKRQSDFFHRFTSAFLESAGMTAGMKVLDVGTGIGENAFLLAERVGPQGTVVGIDSNPTMIDLARRRAQAAGFTNVSFFQGDIGQLVGHAGIE